MVDVFISYSRTDLAAVTRLAEAVEAEGYDVWWDADLPPHLSYGDVITAKIGMAKAAIVVWSKDSATSEWVRAEADMARNQRKLVQTSIDNVMPPLPFNQIQYAEIGDWRGETDHSGWRKVKASLSELVGRDAPPAPRPERPEVVQHHVTAPPPPAPSASKWPLFAGIAVGAIALLGAGWMAMRDGDTDPTEGKAERTAPAQSAQTVAAAEPAATTAAGPQQFAPPPPVEAAPATVEAAPVAQPPPVASTQGMVFPDSSRRLLRPAEIANLGPATLSQARNEIFARKGFRFRRAEIRAYFEQFDWYRPTTDNVQLNRIEQQNVARLQAAESRFGT